MPSFFLLHSCRKGEGNGWIICVVDEECSAARVEDEIHEQSQQLAWLFSLFSQEHGSCFGAATSSSSSSSWEPSSTDHHGWCFFFCSPMQLLCISHHRNLLRRRRRSGNRVLLLSVACHGSHHKITAPRSHGISDPEARRLPRWRTKHGPSPSALFQL